MNNIEIITLTKRALKEAITDNKFWGDTYEPPFSINKGMWMLENCRAEDDDVFAVLGYDKHSIIAFVSLMPDFIKNIEGDLKKIFWSQKWWVANKYKNTVLSTYLKSNSLSEINNQFIVRFLGDKTKTYYEKQPFTKFSKRTTHIIVFNLDHKILISKKARLKTITSFLKFLDKISEKATSFINTRKSKNRTKTLNYKYFSTIDDENWAFIEKQLSKDIVPKTQEYVNWQISNSQYHVINDNEKSPKYKCLLESISKKIYNLNFTVVKEGRTIGFISGLIKEKRFVLRYFITTQDDFDCCIDALMVNLIKSKCTLIQTENKLLVERIKSKYLIIFANSKNLVSLHHNDINMNFQDVIINDRDGNFF